MATAADILKFTTDNSSVLGRLGNNAVGDIIVNKIPDITANASQPDFDLRGTLMQAFTEAAQQVNDPDATFEALSIATELKLESLTGDAAADVQMGELNTFLTNMDQDPGFRTALHGFATNVGVDQLDFSNLSTDPETAARYQTMFTHLSEHEFGQESITRAITTLAQDPDDFTSDDFRTALVDGTAAELNERFGALEGDALFDAMRSTEGLLGDASTQEAFFSNLEADPASRDAFLSAFKSNPASLATLSLSEAQDPSTQSVLSTLISQPLPPNVFTDALAERGINLGGAELDALMGKVKAGIIEDVLGNPDLDLASAESYISNFYDPNTGDLDFTALSAAATDPNSGAPAVVAAIFNSATNTMRSEIASDPANWLAIVNGIGDQWDGIFDNLHETVANLEFPPELLEMMPWLPEMMQALVTAVQLGVPAMVGGVAKIGNLFGAGLMEVDRSYRPEQTESRVFQNTMQVRDSAIDLNPRVASLDAQQVHEAYLARFAATGVDQRLADGILIAHLESGVPIQNIVAMVSQESNFGNYNTHRASSATRLARNFGQIIDGTKGYLEETYGAEARAALGKYGVGFNPNSEWRQNPLVAPYMMAKYMKESGSRTDLKRQYAYYFSGSNRLASRASDPKWANRSAAKYERKPAAANPTLYYHRGSNGQPDRSNPKTYAQVYASVTSAVRDDFNRIVQDVQKYGTPGSIAAVNTSTKGISGTGTSDSGIPAGAPSSLGTSLLPVSASRVSPDFISASTEPEAVESSVMNASFVASADPAALSMPDGETAEAVADADAAVERAIASARNASLQTLDA
ncbi:MAG: hypothetical protein AAF569_00105 [Pseudomonadota bacterium]